MLRSSGASFEPAAMQQLLDGDQAEIRNRVRRILCRPDFAYAPGADIAAQREIVFGWCRTLAAEGIGALALPAEYGGEGDFARFMAAFETIACHDISLTIKFTVQFGLWLGSVFLLGTRQHHEKYLRAIGAMELPGCFAMTEIGHGSNVRDLETEARYDPEREEFVIHSPGFSAGKNYIGNAVCHGRMATVFAQLETGGAARGVHAFLVPIRSAEGAVLPGVRIEDNGPKMGENGVDNGRLWFDRVRVPREALLDRFAQVAPDGAYTSPIVSPGARFFAMISALVSGRISIAAAGLSAAKCGLAIAVRYAARRRQFRSPGAGMETRLLDYPTHQRRLFPLLANAYALDFAHKNLVRSRTRIEVGEGSASAREVERMAAGLKAWTTWNTTATLQICREACGGEGYMSVNRLSVLKADSDVFTTFEGDNTVLMVWTGRNLVSDAAAAGGCGPGSEQEALPSVRGGDPAGNWYLSLLREREKGLLAQSCAGQAGRVAAGIDPRAASDPLALVRLAHAHIERVILEQFNLGIKGCADPSLGNVLCRLRDLFALRLIEQTRAWYLEEGFLTQEESKSLTGQVDALCAELADEAVALVDAFGIPDGCLASPIGKK